MSSKFQEFERRLEEAHQMSDELAPQWVGHPVLVKAVDMYAFLGRDFHPEPEDKGSVGIVIDVYVDCYIKEKMIPQHHEDFYFVLLVQLKDKVVEFMNHEVIRIS